MSTTTFDTPSAARKLEAAGVERRQAEAHAEALREAAGAARDEYATKADLDAAIATLRTHLYRALRIQGGAIVAILPALRFLPV